MQIEMRASSLVLFLLAAALLSVRAHAEGFRAEATIYGSEASMARQHRVAKELDLTFVRHRTDFPRLLAEGALVALSGNADYDVIAEFPFARPEIRLFVERLADQYHSATGEKLVVTSLARPTTRQPRNSHHLSVHPAGMAIDLRMSSTASSRRWLETTLLNLERAGVLDVTRERYPPHYHVAVFPDQYRNYLERRLGDVPLRDSAAVFTPSRPQSPSSYGGANEPGTIGASASTDDAPFYTAFLIDPENDEQMSVVAVLPFICILIGAFGFRRKTRLV